MSRQTDWQKKEIDQGLCSICGKCPLRTRARRKVCAPKPKIVPHKLHKPRPQKNIVDVISRKFYRVFALAGRRVESVDGSNLLTPKQIAWCS
jgi:hypothetical protein